MNNSWPDVGDIIVMRHKRSTYPLSGTGRVRVGDGHVIPGDMLCLVIGHEENMHGPNDFKWVTVFCPALMACYEIWLSNNADYPDGEFQILCDAP